MWTKKSGPRHDLHLFPPLTHRTHMMTWKKRDRNNERVIITPTGPPESLRETHSRNEKPESILAIIIRGHTLLPSRGLNAGT